MLDRIRLAWAALRGREPSAWTPSRERLDSGVLHSHVPRGDSWESVEDRLAAEMANARGTGLGNALLDFVESQMLAAMEAAVESPDDAGCLRRRDLYNNWQLIHRQMTGAMSWQQRRVERERLRERREIEARRDAALRAAGRSSILS